MHELVVAAHSWIRWVVLASGIFAVVACGLAFARNRPWTRWHAGLVRVWTGSFGVQVVLGLLLYFVLSPVVVAAAREGAMRDGLLRFWRIEHPITMIIALAVLHFGRGRARRRSDPRGKHLWIFASSVVGMALVSVAIPWPPKKHGRPVLRGASTTAMLGGCPQPQWNGALPPRLSATGLYAHDDVLADGVEPYTPRFELWSDGAAKRRFIALPPGSTIDTSDPDAWDFPEGTKIWKEFARDGKRLETRLLQKVGPERDAWAQMAYAWDDDERDAIAVPDGRANVRGTDHDVPSASDCSACHGAAPSRVLGFSAIQLAYDGHGLTLATLGDRLRAPVSVPPIPGDDATVHALGTLHANCGHCHNDRQGRPGRDRCYDPRSPFDFFLRVDDLASVESTATWRTAIGSAIVPGDAGGSPLVQRMRRRGGLLPGMPPLASEHVDADAIAIVEAWIDSL